ncbi:MAG TPA: C39 family peptidase [Anaerolineales bacterium]|nr:C39 family peptidase [Anaerolineales bacterium]
MFKRIPRIFQILLVLLVLILLAIGLYFLPPVHSHLAWRVHDLRASIIYFFNPPQDVTFQPSGKTQPTPTLAAGLAATASPTVTLTPTPPPTLQATDTPTITPTPPPASVILAHVPFVDQMGRYNYCGPANLTMALEYWGWKGDPTSNLSPRDQVAAVIKPGEDNPSLNFVDRSQSDVNVMPYEMVDFVTGHTTYKALFRYGGDADLLKRLIAAGFPVITEKGIYEPLLPENTVQWGGHYALTTGYDDAKQQFVWQDSYIPYSTSVGKNTRTSYTDYMSGWRSFNYVFIIVYPADQEAQLDQVLGPYADQYWAAQHALDIAKQEIQSGSLTGNDLFFAMFNQVTSLVNLQNPDYGPAAADYDQANAFYNNQLIQIDKAANMPLPYRIMWYETAPYYAYYFTGRYQDVINLAEANLNKIMATRSLEESWFWMARAEYALGNSDTAYADMRKALYYHPGFQPALDMFALWGVNP